MSNNSASANTCSVCAHLERWRMEMLLAGGASVRAVAEKFGVGYHSVWRHWHRHVDDDRKAALVTGPIKLSEIADRAANENASLLDHLLMVRNTLFRRLAICEIAGDNTGVSTIAGRVLECLKVWAQVTGELARVGTTINNNQLNLFISPQWAEVQSVLVKTLAPFPDARRAVIEAFRGIEATNMAAARDALPPPADNVEDMSNVG